MKNQRLSIKFMTKLATVLICLVLFGCANYVGFTSNVDSTVSYEGKECVTPCRLDVPRAGSVELIAITNDNNFNLEIFKTDLTADDVVKTTGCVLLGGIALRLDFVVGCFFFNRLDNVFIYYETGEISLYNTENSVFANIKAHYRDYLLELNSENKPFLEHLSNISDVEQSEIEGLLFTLDENAFLAEMLKHEKSWIEYEIYE